jgi:hypothetical protein
VNIVPVNIAAITQAAVDVLSNDARLSAVTITRSEDQNLSPEMCPWVGVYRLGVQYPQRTLSGISGMRQQRVQLLVLAQQANGASGQACEDELEELIVNVLSAFLSNPTLNGAVHILDEFEVNYTHYMRTTAGEFMQTAAIQFVAVTNTSIIGG